MHSGFRQRTNAAIPGAVEPWNRGRSSPFFGCDGLSGLVASSVEPVVLFAASSMMYDTIDRKFVMFQALFALAVVAGAANCREAADGARLEKLGALVESMPRLPTPEKLPPPGNGIVSFVVGADGKAHSVGLVRESSEFVGSYLTGVISVLRFRAPAATDEGLRHTVALSVDVVDEVQVRVSDWALASAPRAKVYRSEQYGFSVDTSKFASFCPQSPPSPAAGFFLSSKEADCLEIDAATDIPRARFWAEYNVVDQFDGAVSLAGSECGKAVRLSVRGFAGALKTFECVEVVDRSTIFRFFAQTSNGKEVDERVNYRAVVSVPNGRQASGVLSAVRTIFIGE